MLNNASDEQIEIDDRPAIVHLESADESETNPSERKLRLSDAKKVLSLQPAPGHANRKMNLFEFKHAIAKQLKGYELHCVHARLAIPHLIESAQEGKTIDECELRRRLGIQKSQSLEAIIQAISQTVNLISELTGIEIPPLCTLISFEHKGRVNPAVKPTSLFTRVDNAETTDIRIYRKMVYEFIGWKQIERWLSLGIIRKSPVDISKKRISEAARQEANLPRKNGQSIQAFDRNIELSVLHEVFGLPDPFERARTEYWLSAAGTIDVYADEVTLILGAEVKTACTTLAQLIAAIRQLKKYRLEIHSDIAARGIKKKVLVVLVIAGALPRELYRIACDEQVIIIQNFRSLYE